MGHINFCKLMTLYDNFKGSQIEEAAQNDLLESL